MSIDTTPSSSERIRLKKAVLVTWRILTSSDHAKSDINHLLSFFSGQVGDSQSVRAMIFDENFEPRFIDLLRTPEASRFVNRWRPHVEADADMPVSEQLRFMRHFTDLIAAQHEDLLATHNLAGTSVFEKDGAIRSSITRQAATHTGWTLHLTASGTGKYNCMRRNFSSKRGDLVLFGPDAVYDYAAVGEDEDWQHYWIYFQPSPSMLGWINWPELDPNIFHLSIDAQEIETFETLFLGVQRLNSIYDEVEKALFLNVTEQILIRSQKYLQSGQFAFRDSRVNEIKSHIVANIREPISITELTRVCGLSRSQLSVLFKRVTGQTILAWANDRRMALAAQLLLQTDHSISTVADEVGFSDALYFSRKFKTSIGKSPRDYRKSSIRTAVSPNADAK